MKRLKKFFKYLITCLADLRGLARAVNEAQTPEELDSMICGDKL